MGWYRTPVLGLVHRRRIRKTVPSAQTSQVIVEGVVLHHQNDDVSDLRFQVRSSRPGRFRSGPLVERDITTPQPSVCRPAIQPRHEPVPPHSPGPQPSGHPADVPRSAEPAIAGQAMRPVVSPVSYLRRASTAMSSWDGLRPTRVSMILKQTC